METLNSLISNSPHFTNLCNGQHNSSSTLKVLSLNNSTSVVSFKSNTPSSNTLTFSKFSRTPPFTKSNPKRGFQANHPVIDISLINRKIKHYTDNGLFVDAIKVYVNLLESGFPVEQFNFFPCLIKSFGGLFDVNKGREIHGHVLKLGFFDDIYVRNSILGMYWKCGAVKFAVKFFEEMLERDLVSWNSMVSGLCQWGYYVDSLVMFRRVVEELGGGCLSRATCVSALSSCSSIRLLNFGQAIHGLLLKNGIECDEYVVSGLIQMYMKCGDVQSAECAFERILGDELVRGNKVIWNVMISGYVSNGFYSSALNLFVEMMELGFGPDTSTMVAVLVLCSELFDLDFAKQIHSIIVKFGMGDDVHVLTALLEMYFKCGDRETGLELFRRSKAYNLVLWGSVISNCSQSDYANEALQLFPEFMLNCYFPDSMILLAVLRACSSLSVKSIGVEVHGLAVKLGFESDTFVGGALVDLYGKCRDMESAQKVFSQLQSIDIISWNALISGYAQNEHTEQAYEAFRVMQSEDIRPNAVTLASIFAICSQLSSINLCKEAHCYQIRHGFECNLLVNNSLISTYTKCGDIKTSWTVFKKMSEKNEITWNAMIFGFGMHGHDREMSMIFEQMRESGTKPDHATFTSLLSACSHCGDVEMGWKYFNIMIESYKLEPRLEQYTCIVDLLGRAGHLQEAYNLIRAMPCSPDDRIWGSLLGSCRIHGNEKLAKVVANHIIELDPNNVGYRVLLANLFEESGKWNEVARVRSEIKHAGLIKQPGCSWIEVDNCVHSFTAGDCSHELSEEIYHTIGSLTLEMKMLGYSPHLQAAIIIL